MYYTRLLRVLLVTLSVTSVAQATFRNDGHRPNGALVKRQGTSASANEETTPPPTTTPPTPTPTPTTPPDDDGDDDPTTSTPTKTDTTTSKPTDTKTTTSKDDPKPTDTNTSDDPITETFTEIITTTNSNGEPTSFTSEGTVTKTPGLSQGGSGGASGMTKETRNIVIGVVVGVGGAIVLGALGFVAWRIWGRKKQAEEHDVLMSYGDKHDAGGSSPGGTAGGHARNPFQSTLETYHAPTHVNASSNF